jgi:hypothetical protein
MQQQQQDPSSSYHHQPINSDQQPFYPFHPQQQQPPHNYHHFQAQQQQQHVYQHPPTIPCLVVPQRTESPSPSKVLGRSGILRFGRPDSFRRSSLSEKNLNNNNNNVVNVNNAASVKRPNSTTPTNKSGGRNSSKNPRTGFGSGGFGPNASDGIGGRKKQLFPGNNRPQRN